MIKYERLKITKRNRNHKPIQSKFAVNGEYEVLQTLVHIYHWLSDDTRRILIIKISNLIRRKKIIFVSKLQSIPGII